MRTRIDFLRACFAIGITVAMMLSTVFVFTGETTAETVVESELIIAETPPIPPFTIYGIIYDETGMPVSDASVTVTNLRTGESLDAEFYENGAYEGILEDLPSGYAVNDEVEISVSTDSQTITKIIVVKQLGFGERVDIYFGNDDNNAGSKNILATSSKIQNNPVERTMMSDEPLPLNSEPVENIENSEPIIIDSISTTSDSEPVAEITLVDMRAPPYFRLAFTDKENDLRFSLRNDAEERVIVIVDLYHVEPDGITESFLKTVRFGTLLPGKEKFRNVFEDEEGWIPTEKGRNWIKGEIYIKEKGHERTYVSEFKESFNVVPGWRPVMDISGDWVVDEPTTILNRTIVVGGDVYVNADLYLDYGTLVAGDLIVNAGKTIGANEDIDIAASYDGQYKVEVNSPDGTLNIYGKLWNNDYKNHYWFYMNGTLLIGRESPPDDPGTIENTFGNTSDLSQPGGIICTT